MTHELMELNSASAAADVRYDRLARKARALWRALNHGPVDQVRPTVEEYRAASRAAIDARRRADRLAEQLTLAMARETVRAGAVYL